MVLANTISSCLNTLSQSSSLKSTISVPCTTMALAPPSGISFPSAFNSARVGYVIKSKDLAIEWAVIGWSPVTINT